MLNNLTKTKTAQTGDTITWLVATVVIVVILTISIFAASVFFDKNKELSSNYFKSTDTLASKSMFSYVATKDSDGKMVYEQLREGENLNDFNGKLALKIFRGLFQKDYLNNPNNIWVGFMIEEQENFFESVPNEKYFGSRQGTQRGTESSFHTIPYVSEKIKLSETKDVELALIGK